MISPRRKSDRPSAATVRRSVIQGSRFVAYPRHQHQAYHAGALQHKEGEGLRVLKLLAAPLLRRQASEAAARKLGTPAAETPITVRYHCCPRCTELLPRHPLRPYAYCPLCGLRVEYPDDDAYGLQVVTRSDLSQYTRLTQAAERLSLILAGGGER